MGAKHSKPRIRRNRRFSSLRKRQAPEGSNDPSPTPTETRACGNNTFDVKTGVDDGCRFCGAPEKCRSLSKETSSLKVCDDVIKRTEKTTDPRSFFRNYLDQTDLKVDIPRSPECCRSCGTADKSKSLPTKAELYDSEKLPDKDDEQEWTITLYEIDKMSGRVPREEMVRLMSSIYEAVDAKVGESPQGRKTLRLRLSVTPERRNHTKASRTSSTPQREHSQCRCADCPDTEPSRRRRTSGDNRLRRHESDVSPVRIHSRQNSATRRTQPSIHLQPSHNNSRDNNDRTKHYAKLEGLDNTMHLHRKDHDGVALNAKKERSKSLPQNRHRTWPKLEEAHNRHHVTKHRQRHNAIDHRTSGLRSRRKEPRFASPYDQHFQEAMYLRLRELQRQGAFEMRRATNRGQDSDDADDDSENDFDVEKVKSDPEEKKTEPIGDNDAPPRGNSNGLVRRNSAKQEFSDKMEASVHHHHHYHHRLSDTSVLAAIPSTQDALAVKCITKAANLSCSSVVPKTDDKPVGQHHHHYHHHYHHADK